MIIYKTKRSFKMWAYTVSHNSLILRSPLNFIDEIDLNIKNYNKFNIDIEFTGVEYLSIPTRLSEFYITLLKKDSNTDIYQFHTKEKTYDIIASGCLIAKNTWTDLDRISNFNLDLEHEEIIYESH